MKIIIDIGHPAHVHYFRYLASYFEKSNNSVLFVTREKDIAIELLKKYEFKYINIGKPYKSNLGKIFGLVYFSIRFFIISLKFKPDIFLNATFYSAIVAYLFRKPHISIEDTFNSESVVLFKPFTSIILTGDFEHPNLGKKEIQYSGYQELLYLHPNRFIAKKNAKELLGIKEGEKYALLRFVSWNASHDKGYSGISLSQKIELIETLSSSLKVFISSENKLPKELQKYAINIHPSDIHDVMASADLFIGEGATMASECAMLGTPAIYVNPLDVYTIKEQQNKYGLVFSFRNMNGVIEKAFDIINNSSKEEFLQRRDKMLHDKIDVTAFMVWFVENYPESVKIMKENPDYQYNFR